MNSIVKPENKLALGAHQSDWGNLEPDIKPIRCTVGQPTSRGVEIGKFNFKNKPDWKPTDKLEGVVLLKPHKTRVLYGETFDSPARCGSDNSFVPSARFKVISPECGSCFAKNWDNECDDIDLAKKRSLESDLKRKSSPAPLCNESINIVVIDERMVPFVMTFQKTQIKVVTEKLFNEIKFSGMRMFEQSFDISLIKRDSAKGVWFEYQFSNFKPLEDKTKYKNAWMMMQTSAERMIAEQHEAMDREKQVEPLSGEYSHGEEEAIPF